MSRIDPDRLDRMRMAIKADDDAGEPLNACGVLLRAMVDAHDAVPDGETGPEGSGSNPILRVPIGYNAHAVEVAPHGDMVALSLATITREAFEQHCRDEHPENASMPLEHYILIFDVEGIPQIIQLLMGAHNHARYSTALRQHQAEQERIDAERAERERWQADMEARFTEPDAPTDG